MIAPGTSKTRPLSTGEALGRVRAPGWVEPEEAPEGWVRVGDGDWPLWLPRTWARERGWRMTALASGIERVQKIGHYAPPWARAIRDFLWTRDPVRLDSPMRDYAQFIRIASLVTRRELPLDAALDVVECAIAQWHAAGERGVAAYYATLFREDGER